MGEQREARERGPLEISQGDHGGAGEARSVNVQSDGDTAEREHGYTALMALTRSQLAVGEHAQLILSGAARVALIGSFDDMLAWRDRRWPGGEKELDAMIAEATWDQWVNQDSVELGHDAVMAEAERARYAELDAEVWAERRAYRDEAGWAALWLLVLLGVVLPALIVATRGFGVVSAAMGAR